MLVASYRPEGKKSKPREETARNSLHGEKKKNRSSSYFGTRFKRHGTKLQKHEKKAWLRSTFEEKSQECVQMYEKGGPCPMAGES